MRVRIDVNTGQTDARLRRLGAAGRDLTPLLKTWGNAVAKAARTNARAKGGRRFWAEIAAATRLRSVSARSVEVFSDHFAARHKHYGGVITARRAKYLTIPVDPLSRGHTAAELSVGRDLFVVGGDGRALLGFDDGGKFRPLFVLKRSVFQHPDPWWPDDRTVDELGRREAAYWLDQLEEV